jgi:hypothetical protein
MGQRDRLFSTLSLVIVGLTVVTLICYALIAINPYLLVNPFPPQSQTFVVATLTPSPTVTRTPVATWTPTTTPTITPTPPPTFTPTVTSTPTPTGTPAPTDTPEPTETPIPRVTRSAYPFTYQLTYETPYYGCAWTGVAGTVVDLDGNPLIGYPVHVWGGGIDTVVTSGSKQLYGDSGWEQFFNNAPQEVRGEFRVQLHSRDDPNHPPISQEIVLDFPGFCSRALAHVVFVLNH